MKKKSVIISILMIVSLLLFVTRCAEEDNSLSENVEQSDEKNISDDVSLFIEQNFGSYQNYLEKGGIPLNELAKIIKKSILETGSYGFGGYARCHSEFSKDKNLEKFNECMEIMAFATSAYPTPRSFPSVGPAAPGCEELIGPNPSSLPSFFDAGTADFQIIANINYAVPESINAARSVIERNFPDVIRIAEEYYKNPKIVYFINGPYSDLEISSYLKSHSYAPHYVMEIDNFNRISFQKRYVSALNGLLGDFVPPFGDPICFSEMHVIAEEMGLLSSLYAVGHSVRPRNDYYLLKKIAEMEDAFPIVYPPMIVNLKGNEADVNSDFMVLPSDFMSLPSD
jgi:hypothetical protein